MVWGLGVRVPHCSLFHVWGGYGMAWGLGVRVPHCSHFHDEKFTFFDFGVRGTPKILNIFLGVSLKI